MSKRMVSSLQPNDKIMDYFMVTECQLRPKRSGEGYYLALRLADRSGSLEARIWERGDEWQQRLHPDDIVKIDGRVETYRDEMQIRVERLRQAEDCEYALEDFLPASERDISAMLEELRGTVREIESPYLAQLLSLVLDEPTLAAFARAPGAKRIHHAYLGGLIEHTLEVVAFCRTALGLHGYLDKDLLFCGAILHDIGKLQEYSYQRSIDFTDEGKLIGHITLGHDLVAHRAGKIDGFPPDLLLRLRHIIVSHHGQYEWQSPKRPKTMEACVLHLADFFSSQASIFGTILRESEASVAAWSAYNKYLDRSIYLGSPASPSSYDDDATPTELRQMQARHQSY